MDGELPVGGCPIDNPRTLRRWPPTLAQEREICGDGKDREVVAGGGGGGLEGESLKKTALSK